jgi:hypothetical protein
VLGVSLTHARARGPLGGVLEPAVARPRDVFEGAV